MCYFVSGGVGWIWGGCSDNVAFGEKISKQFVDALEDGHDSRAAVNLHNNEAGRLVRFDLNIIDGFFFFMSIVSWHSVINEKRDRCFCLAFCLLFW